MKATEQRSRLNELSWLDSLTDDQRTEHDGLVETYADTVRQLRAAIAAEGSEEVEIETHQEVDQETREGLVLRDRSSLGGYLLARLRGREPAGALSSAACGVSDGAQLPLFEAVEDHEDAVSPAPLTVGVNLKRVWSRSFPTSLPLRFWRRMPGRWSTVFGRG